MSIYIKIALLIFIFILGFLYSEFDTAMDCSEDGYTEIHGKIYKCES